MSEWDAATPAGSLQKEKVHPLGKEKEELDFWRDKAPR